MAVVGRKQLIVGGLVAVAATAGAWAVVWLVSEPAPPTEKRLHVRVKLAINGHYVKLNKNDKLVYAGIRAPYEREPFHEEARQRNAELTVERELRLRFNDEVHRDDEGRLFGYAFVDDLIDLHFTLGLWIRNNLGLWQGNDFLLAATGGQCPDEASNTIIQLVWRRLRNA